MRTIKTITFAHPEEAEVVIQHLHKLLGRYNFVTRSDLNDLVGVESTFEDEKWGWTILDKFHATV